MTAVEDVDRRDTTSDDVRDRKASEFQRVVVEFRSFADEFHTFAAGCKRRYATSDSD